MTLPNVAEIKAAVERLRSVIVHAPLVPLHSYETKRDILLKVETLQPVTSFKIRGFFNAAASLTSEERQRGLKTASSGNSAQALGWAARYFGVTALSVVPETIPASKLEAIRNYGVTPIIVPRDELFRYTFEGPKLSEPYTFIHPWTNRMIMAGHGTIGLEILEDLPEVETVYVPIGGGGLVSGVGAAIKALRPSVRVVGVQPETSCHYYVAFQAGGPISYAGGETICDGVAISVPSSVDVGPGTVLGEMFSNLREVVDDMVLVPERSVKAAVRRLALRNRLVVEGAGALSVAAALATPVGERGKTVCIVSGGSIDAVKFASILSDWSLV